jgi:hypothetical protein
MTDPGQKGKKKIMNKRRRGKNQGTVDLGGCSLIFHWNASGG